MLIYFNKFQELTLGDKDFGRELIAVYITQFEDYIVELQTLVREKDTDRIKFLNHQIKSSVVTLQFSSLAEKQTRLLKSIFQNDTEAATRGIYMEIAQECRQAIAELRQYEQQLSEK